MTAYAVSAAITFTSGSSTTVAVKAGSYEIKVARIDYGIAWQSWTGSGSTYMIMSPVVNAYSSGSISGGTSITPAPLRQGAGASSSTARYGSVSLPSGGTQVAALNTTSVVNDSTTRAVEPGSITSYQFPYDLTVSAGGVLAVVSSIAYVNFTSSALLVTVYFEELRLSWPY